MQASSTYQNSSCRRQWPCCSLTEKKKWFKAKFIYLVKRIFKLATVHIGLTECVIWWLYLLFVTILQFRLVYHNWAKWHLHLYFCGCLWNSKQKVSMSSLLSKNHCGFWSVGMCVCSDHLHIFYMFSSSPCNSDW